MERSTSNQPSTGRGRSDVGEARSAHKSAAARHLEMVADEFDSGKDTLPDHVRKDRDAIREVLHRLERADALVISLQAHQYTLLDKIARLERERDEWRGLASDKAVALNHALGRTGTPEPTADQVSKPAPEGGEAVGDPVPSMPERSQS